MFFELVVCSLRNRYESSSVATRFDLTFIGQRNCKDLTPFSNCEGALQCLREAWVFPKSKRGEKKSCALASFSNIFHIPSNPFLFFDLGSCFVEKHKFEYLHPPKQTWNLKMDPWKRRFLLETIISRFHVNFLGCISLESMIDTLPLFTIVQNLGD